MSNNQGNTDKILKLIDKFEPEDIPELYKTLKQRMTEKIETKAKEYNDLQEKLLSLSNSINNIK